jgi:hypothetical protein
MPTSWSPVAPQLLYDRTVSTPRGALDLPGIVGSRTMRRKSAVRPQITAWEFPATSREGLDFKCFGPTGPAYRQIDRHSGRSRPPHPIWSTRHWRRVQHGFEINRTLSEAWDQSRHTIDFPWPCEQSVLRLLCRLAVGQRVDVFVICGLARDQSSVPCQGGVR